MFLIDFFWGLLNSLGLSHKNAKILFLGLDNAGKTTLLKMLRDDRMSVNTPTLHPHSEELVIGKIRFRTFDLGGHETARRIWKDYFATVDGIIFLVDAADPSRFHEAQLELNELLNNPQLATVPMVVLGNKIDKPSASSEDGLRNALGLQQHMTAGHDKANYREGVRPIEVFMCSIMRRMGYAEGFRWLSQFLN